MARQRTALDQSGDAGQRGLDRKGHLALDLFGAEGRSDGVDLYLAIGDVGHGVDGQAGQLAAAIGQQGHGE